MRMALVIFCIVAAILTAISAMPGAIFVGLILFIVPGVILIAAPNLLILGVALLAGSVIFAPIGRVARYILPLLLLAIPVFAAPKIWNEPLNRQIAQLTEGDRDFSGFRLPVENLSLLLPVIPGTGVTGQECAEICQRLLFNGSVRSVLAGPSNGGLVEPSFRDEDKLTRYRIARQASCPEIKVRDAGLWPGEPQLGQLAFVTAVSDRTKARIAAGECLIAEPATLADADAIVVQRYLKWGKNPYFEAAFDPHLDTVTASRLSAYQRDGATLREVYRRTHVKAELIGTPLLIGVGSHCSSGACSTRRDFYRTGLDIGAFNLQTFFRDKSGLNVAVPDGVPLASVRSMLLQSLDDPELPASAPQFKLVDQYLKQLAEPGRADNEDVAVLRKIILDKRATDLFHLANAVRVIGQPAAPLAEPLVEGVMNATLLDERDKRFADAIELLPPGAAMPILDRLRDLARDEARRSRTWNALVRLSDAGEDGAPDLLALVDAKPHEGGGNGIWIAGMKGLCLLGPKGEAAVPALMDMIQNDPRFIRHNGTSGRHLGPLGMLAMSALIRMDRSAELGGLFKDEEWPKKQIQREVERLKGTAPGAEICRY